MLLFVCVSPFRAVEQIIVAHAIGLAKNLIFDRSFLWIYDIICALSLFRVFDQLLFHCINRFEKYVDDLCNTFVCIAHRTSCWLLPYNNILCVEKAKINFNISIIQERQSATGMRDSNNVCFPSFAVSHSPLPLIYSILGKAHVLITIRIE